MDRNTLTLLSQVRRTKSYGPETGGSTYFPTDLQVAEMRANLFPHRRPAATEPLPAFGYRLLVPIRWPLPIWEIAFETLEQSVRIILHKVDFPPGYATLGLGIIFL